MKDLIVEEVRKVRKKIEAENGKNWIQLEKYLLKSQKKHKDKLYSGSPNLFTKQVAL
jgi:hypothetical protein